MSSLASLMDFASELDETIDDATGGSDEAGSSGALGSIAKAAASGVSGAGAGGAGEGGDGDGEADTEDDAGGGASGSGGGADQGEYNTGGEYTPLEDTVIDDPDAVEDTRGDYNSGGGYQSLEDYIAEEKAVIAQQLEDGEITEEEAAEQTAAFDELGAYEGIDAGDESFEGDGSFLDDYKAAGVSALNKFNNERWVTDPPGTGLFTVFISFAPGLAFLKCEGLQISNAVESRTEGGVNHHEYQFAGQTSHGEIRFTRGYLLDPSALAIQLWRYKINSSSTPMSLSGLIILHDDSMQPIGAWYFSNGMISTWTAPGMASGSSEIAVEEMTIVHEGLTIIDTPLQLLGMGTDALSRMGSEAPSIPTDVMLSIF